MALPQYGPKKKYIPDKCNPPPVDMGSSIVFADSLPGLNDICARPFGCTEYDYRYTKQFCSKPKNQSCKDPCKPKFSGKKFPQREFYPSPKGSNVCNQCHKAKCCCNLPWEKCKERVTVVEPNIIRKLPVHDNLKNEHPFVLSKQDYCRLIERVNKKDETEKECLEEQRRKEECREYCQRKAEELKIIDRNRMQHYLSPEAQADMAEIICRSDKIIKEDEPEVRRINQVILAAKVAAIREAQLVEREIIRCEQEEEERRLNALLEQEKDYGLSRDDEKELERLEQRKKDLQDAIKSQLEEKEAFKFLEKELQEEENVQLRRIWEQMDLDEMNKKRLEVEKKFKKGNELIEDQIRATEVKKNQKELDRVMDQKLLEYNTKKAQEEDEMEKRKLEEKKAKEMVIHRLSESQKKSTDEKEIRIEMKARKAAEEQEREWRRRERESVEKKRRDIELLKNGILEQIVQKQANMIEQAALEKAEHEQNINILENRYDDSCKKDDDLKLKNARYRFELREQIHDYQKSKIQERRDYYIDAVRNRRDFEKREQEIHCFLQSKLEELRDSKLPEKYINYIRQAVEAEIKPEWQKKVGRVC